MKRKFIINKTFSINSAEDFRDYAHTIMKQAHGDEYSEETTNKVVDDLLNDNPNADYGELIGRLTSGFGQKSFASSDLLKSYRENLAKREDKLKQLQKDLGSSRDPKDMARVDKARLQVLEAKYYIELEELKDKYEQQRNEISNKIIGLNLEFEKVNKKLS